MQSVNNVIIRNCRFTLNGVPILKDGENKIVAWRDGAQVEVGDPDCVGIQADKESAQDNWGAHIWVDHCEFFNGNAADKDRYDGLLDCKNNVQWLTFSYNHFHNHDKACLFGKGNSDVFGSERTISFHHNYFQNIEGSRLPLQRGGYMHYMNNYMDGCQDGWDLRAKSIGYLDACYFKDSKAPVLPDGGGSLNINKAEGYDIYYTGCARLIKGYTNADGSKVDKEISVTSTDWVPTASCSSYFVNNHDKTADVPSVVTKYAGAGKIEIYKAYAETIPAVDINEYANAVKNYETARTYDEKGNKITNVETGILTVEKADVTPLQWYSIDGRCLNAPKTGVNIRVAGKTDKIVR